MTNQSIFDNPFRPGAGHSPPYLAGREVEKNEFSQLLKQSLILGNMILTGLRGVGKTVLLEEFKSLAQKEKWIWVGTELSEAESLSDERIAERLIVDLSVFTSTLSLSKGERKELGFTGKMVEKHQPLDYNFLRTLYNNQPGLVKDKLKHVLLVAADVLKSTPYKGIVFAYDEAQNLSDQAESNEYPLSTLLDTFQSIQRQNAPFLLTLAGLPTLHPKLVDARTYSERMFRVLKLGKLSREESRQAVSKPIEDANCPVRIVDESIDEIVLLSGGYPYFIQFICRHVYDTILQQMNAEEDEHIIPLDSIVRKLDSEFFAARWGRLTGRQKDLMAIIARLETESGEFSNQQLAEASEGYEMNPFSSSQVTQLLGKLTEHGVILRHGHGSYFLVLPLFDSFIKRETKSLEN